MSKDSPIDRKLQQAQLLQDLGRLLAPLQDIAENWDRHDEQGRSRACARMTVSQHDFRGAMSEFARGEPGAMYDVEFDMVTRLLNQFVHRLGEFRDDRDALARELTNTSRRIQEAILRIPVDVPSHVIAAGSPFVAYRTLKALLGAARDQVACVDPYMDRTLFHRYFADIPPAVSISLVTSPKSACVGEFLDVSRLFAAERGPRMYRLIQNSALHDRILLVDRDAYHLGGSLKDAGRKKEFSLTRFDDVAETAAKIDEWIESGDERFGPSSPQHP